MFVTDKEEDFFLKTETTEYLLSSEHSHMVCMIYEFKEINF